MLTVVSRLHLSPIYLFPSPELFPEGKGKVGTPESDSVIPDFIIFALFNVDAQVSFPSAWNVHSVMNGWLIL